VLGPSYRFALFIPELSSLLRIAPAYIQDVSPLLPFFLLKEGSLRSFLKTGKTTANKVTKNSSTFRFTKKKHFQGLQEKNE